MDFMGAHAAWPHQLEQGLRAMDVVLDEGRQALLLDYLALLQKWNRAYNLTAIRDPGQMVARQLLDSLSIKGLLHGQRILDVGTGPGLPGIPLSILYPQRVFTLLDANGKKTRFVQQAVFDLGLKNVQVVQQRIESWRPAQAFDSIVSRAFSALPKMLRLTRHLLHEDGLLLAMKGSVPEEEIQQLRQEGVSVQVHRLAVPGTDGERHAILCRYGIFDQVWTQDTSS